MKKKRYSKEQRVRLVREIEVLVGQGSTAVEAARSKGISEQSYYRWRNEIGAGATVSDVRRLKDLERENARLKKLVANKELELDMLREVAKGNF